MINFINEYVVKIKRYTSHSSNLAQIYTLWFLIVFSFLFIFGVVPGIRSIFEKIQIVSEMSKVNKSLSNKSESLKKSQKELETYQSAIKSLDHYLPDDFLMSSYMVEFVLGTADSGFTIVRFVPGESNDDSNQTSIMVSLKGLGSIQNLISNVESLKSVTEVEKIGYIVNEDTKDVTLNIRVFKLN